MTPWEKEWRALEKREQQYLDKKKAKKISALNQLLEDKVPPNLQGRLDTAFSKAFGLVFEKGTGIIEKTYKKQQMEEDYQIHAFTAEVKKDRKSLRNFSKKANTSGNKNLLLSGVEGVGLGILGIGLPDIPLFTGMIDRKSLRNFSKKANTSGNKNLLLSGVEGVGLGILGIGLPDIPLFTGMILKSIYEIALHYGYGYETEEEKYFILLLIRCALARERAWEKAKERMQAFLIEEQLPPCYDRELEIQKTAEVLSQELLYMKFLQGLPVVGAVGGAYDAIYLNAILQYGKIVYKKRFLLKHKGDKHGTESGNRTALKENCQDSHGFSNQVRNSSSEQSH